MGLCGKKRKKSLEIYIAVFLFILKRLPGFLASVRVETARGAAAPDPQRRRRESEEMSGFCVRGGRDRRDTDINIQREREKEQPPLRPGSLVFFFSFFPDEEAALPSVCVRVRSCARALA